MAANLIYLTTWEAYLKITLAWFFYLAIHSLLASSPVKRVVDKHAAWLTPYYRALYSLMSTIGLLYLFYLMATYPKKLLFDSTGWIKYPAMVLASWGVIIVMVSFRQISGLSFLGLKPRQSSALVTDGIHGYIRHPIYSGTIMIFLGMFLYHPTDLILLTNLMIFLYLPFGIYWEESKLIEEYGDVYLAYKRKVPALIPPITHKP